MQEELRRSNTIGDSKGILYFADTVLKNGEIKRDSARHICSFINDIRVNFNSAVAFFEYLGFISVSTNSIEPTEDGKRLYEVLDAGFEEALCERCLNKITAEGIIDLTAIRFDTDKGSYCIQKHGFPIFAAVFRNVLIQMKALVERCDGALELSERYESVFVKVQKTTKQRMTLESLKKQLEQQETQGEAAELFVLQYEQNRLEGSENKKRIKRISDIDVAAGYDILSFENSEESEYNRFIEVKSYVGNPHFYWSKNEIDTATLLGGKYYIYLVDADKTGKPNYAPTIIHNPAQSVLVSGDWLLQPTSYLVLPTGGVYGERTAP